ncbi:GNAT family N-acetyltransferase [Lichenibacterium ramalinae]|uniref:GNAT family N-acetyltransferase n=2 Tax=Lichenibacterium ramalinae TaxID=2316527 RepID=A0A4Q2RFS4_9HYPH|nr:GNAT family N-acetyltransferase [Lichenibacterium ramalinae]
MRSPPFSVADLRERPEFAPVVADRVWRAWWKPKGHALAPIAAFTRTCLADAPIPSALVAHDATGFLGSALVIASDLSIRPQYTPWVAAVWVDPQHRNANVGSGLVRAGAEAAKRSGFATAYLCAMPHNHAFYERLGWSIVETDVDGEGLAVFRSR